MVNVIKTQNETVLVEPTPKTTPVVSPILNLLRSRKFIVAVASVVASIIVTGVPALAPYVDLIVTAIVTLGIFLVGGIAFEDALIQGRVAAIENPPVNVVAVEVKELLRVALEEKLLDSTKTEEEKQVLRDLLERLLAGIPEGEVALKV